EKPGWSSHSAPDPEILATASRFLQIICCIRSDRTARSAGFLVSTTESTTMSCGVEIRQTNPRSRVHAVRIEPGRDSKMDETNRPPPVHPDQAKGRTRRIAETNLGPWMHAASRRRGCQADETNPAIGSSNWLKSFQKRGTGSGGGRLARPIPRI